MFAGYEAFIGSIRYKPRLRTKPLFHLVILRRLICAESSRHMTAVISALGLDIRIGQWRVIATVIDAVSLPYLLQHLICFYWPMECDHGEAAACVSVYMSSLSVWVFSWVCICKSPFNIQMLPLQPRCHLSSTNCWHCFVQTEDHGSPSQNRWG